MARFYFNVRDANSFHQDTVGVDLPDVASAHREASQAARELMIEEITLGKPVTQPVFEVCDIGGVLLFTLDFKDLLHGRRGGRADDDEPRKFFTAHR